jgi:ribokinase
MKHEVICIGSACKDIFFPTSEGKIINTPEDLLAQKKIEFELGAKYKIETRYEALGGCAANVACGLSRLGIETACLSHIGDDLIADWIKGEFEKNGVNTNLITREHNYISDMSAIVVDKESGDRVIYSNQKVNIKLEISEDKLKNTEWFFIGDLEGGWEEKLEKIISISEKHKIKVAINPRYSNIHENTLKVIDIIAKTEIVFLNKDEAIEIISKHNLSLNKNDLNNEEFLIKELQKINSKIVVITDGVRGAWVYDGKDFIHENARVVRAIDSTGAGDSFNSGFLAAYLKEKEIRECLKWGIINSSSVVQHYGSIEGLLDEKNILTN